MSVFQNLQNVSAMTVFERRQAPVINDQHWRLFQLREEPRVAPICSRHDEFFQKARQALVRRPVAAPARKLAQSARQVGLADACRSAQKHIEVLGYPSFASERRQHFFRETIRCRRSDVLKARVLDTMG